jgi:NADPH-dependent glutamate synthase beta subunit-like oxidoreductase
MKLRTSSSHREAEQDPRNYALLTKEFLGNDHNQLKAVRTVNVEFNNESGRSVMDEVEGTIKDWKADLVLLALGFVGPERGNVINGLGIELDERGNIKTSKSYQTNVEKVFAAGDCHRGQSLVVWAISEGRETARNVDLFLMGETDLPTKGDDDLPRR